MTSTCENNATTPVMEDLRVDYGSRPLELEDLDADPILQFGRWFQEAHEARVAEPNAVVLATVSAAGKPSTRTVLIKNYDSRGFVFFTNLESRKAQQIGENQNVSILFPWITLQRQLIVEGTAERISTAEAMTYFLKRPRGSQIAAAVSRQSTTLTLRAVLESEFERMKRKIGEGEVPFPSSWGGYRVKPTEIEFWQGRSNRLHDRFRYRAGSDGGWTVERLAP